MTMLKHVTIVIMVALVPIRSRPQTPEDAPMAYDFTYKVEDEANSNYFGQNEVGTDQGRVDGSYFVWLPDGRLMTIKYYVDGESGFVPQISFQDKATPLGGR